MSKNAEERKYAKSVLFACLGNIIRSPLCEGLLKTLVHGVYVDSAAVTRDDLNQHPHKHSQRVAKEHGYDISNHVSRLITNEDFQKFDIIVSLEDYVHYCLERKKPPNSRAIVVRFASYDIDNPWCNPYRDFVTMYAQIEQEMPNFIKQFIDPANINQK